MDLRSRHSSLQGSKDLAENLVHNASKVRGVHLFGRDSAHEYYTGGTIPANKPRRGNSNAPVKEVHLSAIYLAHQLKIQYLYRTSTVGRLLWLVPIPSRSRTRTCLFADLLKNKECTRCNCSCRRDNGSPDVQPRPTPAHPLLRLPR